MSNVVTATPIWKLWADALDRAQQGIAFVTDAGNQCAATAGAGLTVNVASGTVVVNSNTTTTAISAGSVTPTSPTNNPRRDIVFISSLGTISLTQGSEAPAPLPPALPTGACLLAVLFIPQSATDYSAGFPTGGIEDLRVIVKVDNAAGIASPRTLGTEAQQAAGGTHTTPTATATVAGHVPTPPNDTTKYLRGDATWAIAAVGGTPAVVLGTTAAAGVATTFLRDDDTIVAFDATVPSTQAFGDAAAAGVATVASHRDHKHAMPKVPIVFYISPGSASLSNMTAYIALRDQSATEAQVSYPLPACTMTQMFVKIQTAAGAGQSYQFTVFKNGVSTALDITLSGSTTTGSVTGQSIAYAAGDTISIRVIGSATAAAQGFVQATVSA